MCWVRGGNCNCGRSASARRPSTLMSRCWRAYARVNASRWIPSRRGCYRAASRVNKIMGIAGRLSKFFLHSQLTPLIALVAMLLGLFAVLVTPREEEPQINVTMANVLIPFPGASSADVQNMVARPAEQVLSQIAGIEHTYSVARPGLAVLTVQFKVGVARTEALVRLYDVLNANQNWLPREVGTLTPIVMPKGIDDVPVLGVTLWSRETLPASALERVAHAVEAEIKSCLLYTSDAADE